MANWEAIYEAQELQRLLADAGIDVGEISDVKILERGPTEADHEVRIDGSAKSEVVSGPQFRLAVDSTRMKSTLVDQFEFSKWAAADFGYRLWPWSRAQSVGCLQDGEGRYVAQRNREVFLC